MTTRVIVTDPVHALGVARGCRAALKAFCLLGESASGLSGLLRSEGFEDLTPPPASREVREDFLKEYRLWMGELSAQYASRLWWGTDLGTKNRVRVQLPDAFFQLITAIRVCDEARDQDILLLVVSADTAGSFVDALRGRGVDAACRIPRWKLIAKFMAERARRIASLVYETGLALIRIAAVRLLIGPSVWKDAGEDKEWTVVKTFFYDSSFPVGKPYKDVFFGRLFDHLCARGHVLVLGANLGRFFRICREIRRRKEPVILVPLEACLGWLDVLRVVGEILLFRLPSKKAPLFQGVDVDAFVRHQFTRTFKGMQVYQLLHYYAFKRLLRRVRTAAVISTYEVNPWEMMMGCAIRESGKPIGHVGYQHTVVPPAFLGMFPSAAERAIMPLPQRILTTGEVNAQRMIGSGAYRPGEVLPACALRFEGLRKEVPYERRGPVRRLLLGLEGLYEAHQIVDYVLEQLAGGPHDMEIMVRTHPTLPWSRFERAFRYGFDRRRGCRVSSGTSLKEDLAWSDCVLYWGSTVAIEAVCLGRPVINFRTTSVLDFDPLCDLKDFKWEVDRGVDLRAVLQKIEGLTKDEFSDQRRKARAYIDRYFWEVTDQRLELFCFGVSHG